MIVQPIDLSALPSVYATHPSVRVSGRYGFVPTSVIVHALGRAGFVPVQARAARVAHERTPFAKHMIRFRHRSHLDVQVGDWLPEVVLVNSHDGSSSFRVMAGVFRLVCLNGLVIGNAVTDAWVRHTKNAPDEIIDASFRVIAALPNIARSVETMRHTRLNPPEREAFASAALVLRYQERAPIDSRQLLEPRRTADESTDLWTTFNVVQENLLRGGQRQNVSRRRTRRISSVGEDVRLNQALWTLAEHTVRFDT
jgi:hypothetical protein